MRFICPENINTCTDIEELEDARDRAYGECAEYNCCDPGCMCWNDTGKCDLNLITERMKELEEQEETT